MIWSTALAAHRSGLDDTVTDLFWMRTTQAIDARDSQGHLLFAIEEHTPTRYGLCLTPYAWHYRRKVNRVLPGLRMSGKPTREWVTESDGYRRPFHDFMTYSLDLMRSPHWEYTGPITKIDRTGISKTTQLLVRRWAEAASSHDQAVCALCVFHNNTEWMARSLDGGIHERQHLLEHLVARTLPRSFMAHIQIAAGLDAAMLRPPAKYHLAINYAHHLLRST
jgi:hypothetical protein